MSRCEDKTITAILVDGGFYRRRAYKLPKKEQMNLKNIVKGIYVKEKGIDINYIVSFIMTVHQSVKKYIIH